MAAVPADPTERVAWYTPRDARQAVHRAATRPASPTTNSLISLRRPSQTERCEPSGRRAGAAAAFSVPHRQTKFDFCFFASTFRGQFPRGTACQKPTSVCSATRGFPSSGVFRVAAEWTNRDQRLANSTARNSDHRQTAPLNLVSLVPSRSASGSFDSLLSHST